METQILIENKQIDSYELSPYEKMLLNGCICGDCLVMSSVFIENDNARVLISKEAIKKSLSILNRRHPFLRAYVKIDKDQDKAILNIKQQDVTDKLMIDWLDLSNEQFSRTKLIEESAEFNSKFFDFNNENLLWRAQVIKYRENSVLKYLLNFVINLFISDGLNTTTLSIEWVNILNALLTRKVCEEMRVRLEPIESLHSYCEKFNLVNYKKLKEEINKAEKKINRPKFTLPSELGSSDQSGFGLDFIKIDKETTQKILNISKLKKVRQTAYFHTLFLYSLRDLYTENKIKFPRSVYVDISANLRLRYETNLDFSHIRCHAAMVKFQTDIKNFGQFRNFWKDAQYVESSIQESVDIEKALLFSVTHNEEMLNKSNEFFNKCRNVKEACEKMSKFIECDLVLSNLGKHINDRVKVFPGPLKIKELYCSDSLQSKPSKCPAIIIHVLYWNNELMVQIGANKSKLAPKYLDRLSELFKQRLDKSLNVSINQREI